MRGFKITCTASGYREGSFAATKGWWVQVAESDPLVAKLKGNPAFKFEPTEVPDVFEVSQPTVVKPEKTETPEKPEMPEKTENDDIAKVPGVPANLIAGLKVKGYDTVAKVQAAGIESLDEIEGIGIPMATTIMDACDKYLGEK